MKYIFQIIIFVSFFSCTTLSKKETISIEWTQKIEGDYTFAKKWSYAENVFTNEFGQLVCDGMCSEELDRMRDKNGRIPNDSLDKYYQLLDTTHHYYTMEYNYNGWENRPSYIEIERTKNDTIECHTWYGVSDYSILRIKIIGNECIPYIELTSPNASVGFQVFNCTKGAIRIDRQLWEKGIMKAAFDFSFTNEKFPEEEIWKGKILTKIITN